jgi:biopolymer transport protein ExbD
MATTIFKSEEGIEVRLPRAQTSVRQKKDQTLHVWIDRNGRVSLNNRFVVTNEVRALVAPRVAAQPGLVVSFNADERAPYRAVAGVLEQLKEANAVHVSFTSEPNRRENRTP